MKVFTLYLFLEFCFIPKIKVLELRVPSFQNLRTLEDNCDLLCPTPSPKANLGTGDAKYPLSN